MKAMVLAAGLGTRLRPLTYEITKPMVPVLDRPVMEHILDLVDRYEFDGVIANLHYFPDTIREYFGERISYRYEEELLGTAGGVRACAEFFGDEAFLVISGDALTDIDLGAFVARHRESGGIATLSVKQVADTREYGVVLHDRDRADHRLSGEAVPRGGAVGPRQLRDLHLRAGDLRLLPRPRRSWTGPKTSSRRCSRTTCRFTSTRSASTGTTSARSASCARARSTRCRRAALGDGGRGDQPGVTIVGDSPLREDTDIDGDAWIGRGVGSAGVRLMGPIVLGDGARIGDGAQLRESIVFPGTESPRARS